MQVGELFRPLIPNYIINSTYVKLWF